ncbi:MAG: electron transport complex subunit RsxC, partial [Betaproteobacteria bacterium HGW-Betaproteobacteria-20]
AETAETLKTESAEPSAAETQAKQDKQALIAAAIERAKAQKLAAAQAGIKPRNTENVSAAIQAEINETDAIREKAKLTLETNDANTK